MTKELNFFDIIKWFRIIRIKISTIIKKLRLKFIKKRRYILNNLYFTFNNFFLLLKNLDI